MEPEDRIKSCIRNDTHMSSVADQTMDSIVQVFNAVIGSTSAIRPSGVREWPKVGLRGEKLVSHIVETTVHSLVSLPIKVAKTVNLPLSIGSQLLIDKIGPAVSIAIRIAYSTAEL